MRVQLRFIVEVKWNAIEKCKYMNKVRSFHPDMSDGDIYLPKKMYKENVEIKENCAKQTDEEKRKPRKGY